METSSLTECYEESGFNETEILPISRQSNGGLHRLALVGSHAFIVLLTGLKQQALLIHYKEALYAISVHNT